MPFTYEIDRSRDLTLFTATGNVTHDVLIDTIDSYVEAGPTNYELHNLLNVTGITVTFEQIRQLIERVSSRSTRTNFQTAIVASSDSSFKMARIFQGMTEVEKTPQKAKVFRSLDDAYEWLDIPPEGSGSD